MRQSSTVAAGLNRDARHRLAREIIRHDGRRSPQKRKRAPNHSPVALRDEFWHARRIVFRKNGDTIPIKRPMQICVGFTRGNVLEATCPA
jgi:hypothetical protein